MTIKYNIRRSIDAGRPVAEDEPEGQPSEVRFAIIGFVANILIFSVWVAWIIFK